MIKVEIFHSALERANISVAENAQKTAMDGSISWEIYTAPELIKIEFFPAHIVPKIRINDCLINHWLADVNVSQGTLDLPLSVDFVTRYRNKDLQGRKDSLGANAGAIVLDRNIGNELHMDLVETIRNLINEKSRTH